jgi:hypothetical protein
MGEIHSHWISILLRMTEYKRKLVELREGIDHCRRIDCPVMVVIKMSRHFKVDDWLSVGG